MKNIIAVEQNMCEVDDIKTIQDLLYSLMHSFHEICEKNNLYYSVFGGTLLGAVRHNGIIPWDDDIDVCMPRKDYEKFCKIVNEKYSKKYIVMHYPLEGYVYNYAKFCLRDSLLVEYDLRPKFSQIKLYIDVFPIDGYPPAEKEKRHFDRLTNYKKAKCKSIFKINSSKTWWKKPYCLIKFFTRLPYRLIGYKYFLKKELRENKKYDFDSSDYISMQGAGWNEKGKLKKDIFLKRKLYKFGEINVWGLEDYDKHLSMLYGDYMTLPPKEKRTSNHTYKLFIKE